ncbi:MAG: ATP-dependent DNA helicase [Clostridiales bacterium]|jgi:Rad3-related DNA helicase|nr:ATP-dependent DNA helicase [Clostridiales bacterium]
MDQQTNPLLKIAVRSFTEFILRSGDISAGFMSAARALEGTRAHQKIQKQRKKEAKSRGEVYESEVPLQLSFTYREFDFQLDGRADGVLITPGVKWAEAVPEQAVIQRIVIEEIKSTLTPAERLDAPPDHWHWAQAKCYGYMLCVLRGLTGAGIRLTYGHIETGAVKSFEEDFSFEALKTFFFDLIEKYYVFAEMDARRVQERNDTARALTFPYGQYRAGQRELCVSVYAAVKQGRKLFAQAPTGIGKTMSALFPAIKALPEGLAEKIFYLTAKTVTRRAAEDALADCAAAGLRLRSVTLTAKDKICFQEPRVCDPAVCPYAKGHFDRVNEAIVDIVSHETALTRPILESYARKHCVCPFETALDVSLFCDVVICDYNHVYDPNAQLKRYFQDGGAFILLNDEAHNLVERGREMFSASLRRDNFMRTRKLFSRKSQLYHWMGVIARGLKGSPENAQATKASVITAMPPEELYAPLREFASEANDWLSSRSSDRSNNCPDDSPEQTPLLPGTSDASPSQALLELYFNVLDFLRAAETYDERFVTFWEARWPGQDEAVSMAAVRLYCLDPSYLLARETQKSRAAIFFSATLTPLEYFRAVLGGAETDFSLRLASPYPRENLGLFVDRTISAQYKNRHASYAPIARRLHEMVTARKGNYLVFFSSYEYLNMVHDLFAQTYPDIETIAQTSDMTEENRETFLSRFAPDKNETLLAFAVLGGLFSEGIDLKAEKLIGAAIVGVGLPFISEERGVIADYYTKACLNGFAYAYQYPGMNKVLQAAGRVIRSETDRGVVLLMDSRFSRNDYQPLFPLEWRSAVWLNAKSDFTGLLRTFWQ